MALLKPIENGRMYPGWWRWNPIGGCEHGCSYCSIKRIEKRSTQDMTTPVFREHYLKDNLGSGRKIFCCSSGDAWGKWVPSRWIGEMLDHCLDYPGNEYMLLTKYPLGYQGWWHLRQRSWILGATVETDDTHLAGCVSVASDPLYRMAWMGEIKEEYPNSKTMISLEPVIKFSADFIDRLQAVAPDIIYVGVDSGNNGLPEPTADELADLIRQLRTFTDVRLKKGIERILGDVIQVISGPRDSELVPCEGRKLWTQR